ncbi:serine protease 55 isoform X2 [Caretta caretta]|uniref:serine protease 55 isoform X2 n=1 Tax=Caretta caretta TaxID=8467 RepID=UPI003F4C3597
MQPFPSGDLNTLYKAGCGFRPGYDSLSTSPVPRIIGGQKSRPGEWPWIVSIQTQGHHFCGGSVIHSWWVLSAAHCFHDIRPQDVRVAAGSVTLGVGGVTRRVRRILSHPSYSRTTYDSDLALLLLSRPLPPGRGLGLVCLPGELDEEEDAGQWGSCFVAGWGTTEYGQERVSGVLREAGVRILDWLRCMWWMGTLTQNMVCARLEEGGRDACQVRAPRPEPPFPSAPPPPIPSPAQGPLPQLPPNRVRLSHCPTHPQGAGPPPGRCTDPPEGPQLHPRRPPTPSCPWAGDAPPPGASSFTRPRLPRSREGGFVPILPPPGTSLLGSLPPARPAPLASSCPS